MLVTEAVSKKQCRRMDKKAVKYTLAYLLKTSSGYKKTQDGDSSFEDNVCK